jgi:hypothetical protein
MGGGSSMGGAFTIPDLTIDPIFDTGRLVEMEAVTIGRCFQKSNRSAGLLGELEKLQLEGEPADPDECAKSYEKMTDLLEKLGEIWEEAPEPVRHRRLTEATLGGLSAGDTVVFMGFSSRDIATGFEPGMQEFFRSNDLMVGREYEVAQIMPGDPHGRFRIYDGAGNDFMTHWKYFGLREPAPAEEVESGRLLVPCVVY